MAIIQYGGLFQSSHVRERCEATAGTRIGQVVQEARDPWQSGCFGEGTAIRIFAEGGYWPYGSDARECTNPPDRDR
jgi:hypothetical protein